jgi:hypothetical protein
VAAKNRQQTFADSALGDEILHGIGKFVQSGTVRANRQDRARLAKHEGRLARLEDAFQPPKQKRPPNSGRFLSC